MAEIKSSGTHIFAEQFSKTVKLFTEPKVYRDRNKHSITTSMRSTMTTKFFGFTKFGKGGIVMPGAMDF